MKKNKTTKRALFHERKKPPISPKKPTEKQLILSMIRDDLVNYRLVMGLNRLGLVTELYFINASQMVFDFMGIDSDVDDLRHYARYEQLKEEVMEYNLEDGRKKLNALAEKIYGELMAMKFLNSSTAPDQF